MVGISVCISAPFSDPDTDDTHSATCDWGDGSPLVACTVDEDAGTVSCCHTYSAPGKYTVSIVLSDNGGLTDSEGYSSIIVSDPSGGFITGGGWIMSPAASYPPDSTLSGKVTFEFVSRYKKGGTSDGTTEFRFRHQARIYSEGYDWLVVAGPKAQFKGTKNTWALKTGCT